MKIEYYKRYSRRLGRVMEFKVYGHAGQPWLFFPCQNGRFYDFENFKMTDVWAPVIEAGKVQMFTVDTIDGETWSFKSGNPHRRIERHEQWFWYVTDELLPEILKINSAANGGQNADGIMNFGCSMGAMHAANFFLRRPDLFSGCLCLSGLYGAEDSFGAYTEPLIYDNSPVDFLKNMPLDHPYIRMYNERKMIFCVGQGAWEDELKASTRELELIFRQKGIHAWFDYWGYDVSHDWYWWYMQVKKFLPYVT